jgi:hypothetical protein
VNNPSPIRVGQEALPPLTRITGRFPSSTPVNARKARLSFKYLYFNYLKNANAISISGFPVDNQTSSNYSPVFPASSIFRWINLPQA